jgi:hypothetical protein
MGRSMIGSYDGHMKRKVLWTAVGLVVVLVIGIVIWECRSTIFRHGEDAATASLEARLRKAHDAKLKDGNCKKRGDAYEARVEALTREAHAKLKIGTKKEAVVRFFAENGIPVTFTENEASGTIYTTGCSPMGCGSDTALLGLRVSLDENGSVTSEPDIGALYTDCL